MKNKKIGIAVAVFYVIIVTGIIIGAVENKKETENREKDTATNTVSSSAEEEKILISSDEYYAFVNTVCSDAEKNSKFTIYDISTLRYPYYVTKFLVNEELTEDAFYAEAEKTAREIYGELVAKEYEVPPWYKYSYDYISLNFYTTRDRNIGANCCYQFEISKIAGNKSFEENVTALVPKH